MQPVKGRIESKARRQGAKRWRDTFGMAAAVAVMLGAGQAGWARGGQFHSSARASRLGGAAQGANHHRGRPRGPR